jgi:hypothetical protein
MSLFVGSRQEQQMDRPKPKFLTGIPTWLDNKWGRRILAVWALLILLHLAAKLLGWVQ